MGFTKYPQPNVTDVTSYLNIGNLYTNDLYFTGFSLAFFVILLFLAIRNNRSSEAFFIASVGATLFSIPFAAVGLINTYMVSAYALLAAVSVFTIMLTR